MNFNEIIDNFSFDRFLFSLSYVWEGMLCIFLVIGVIILSIYLMNSASKRSKKIKKD